MNTSQSSARVPGGLICNLTVPEEHRRLMEGSGVSSTFSWDERRYSRVRQCEWCILEYLSSLPSIPRPAARHAVLLLNYSKIGFGFLHSEQLYPCETFRLRRPDEETLTVQITCCRRLDQKCYLVGATRLQETTSP